MHNLLKWLIGFRIPNPVTQNDDIGTINAQFNDDSRYNSSIAVNVFGKDLSYKIIHS